MNTGGERSVSIKRSKVYFKKRIETLRTIDNYLVVNGPTDIPRFVLNVNILRSTIYRYLHLGYFISEKPGKNRILISVNWGNVRYKPLIQTYRNKQMSKIKELTKERFLSLKRLNRLTGVEISTLRYWRNMNLLLSDVKGGKVYITGVREIDNE